MTIREIITEHLKANGFDGLCNPYGDCGCLLGDLMPCDEPDVDECQPGYKGPPTPDGGTWAVYLAKQADYARSVTLPDGSKVASPEEVQRRNGT